MAPPEDPMARIAILGTGKVGRALATGLKGKNEVRFGSRDPTAKTEVDGFKVVSLPDAAAWAEFAILAIPYRAVKDTIDAAGPGNLRGKVVIDPTNAVSPSMELAVGFTTSGAEELAKLVPGASVVKAFNTVFAKFMSTGRLGGTTLTLPVAGDDRKAKEAVMAISRDIGFDPVDAGPLRAARYLEPMGMHFINLAIAQKMGPDIGYRLVRG